MLKTNNRFLGHKLALVLALVFGMVSAAPLAALTIEIQFSGLDIEYDGLVGFDIVDKDPGGGDPDPLNTATFLVDGAVLDTLEDDLSIDLSVPGVTGISKLGDTIISATGGSMELKFGGTDSLALALEEVVVTYVDVLGVFQFAFGGTVASVSGQSLPFGLSIDDTVAVSFSTQIESTSLSDDGTDITAFIASGTGEVEGELTGGPNILPEPTTIALAMFGLIAISLGSRAEMKSSR